MSRKSVLTTLKKDKIFLNLSSFNTQTFSFGLSFLSFLKNLFLKKSVLLINEKLNFSNNTVYLILDLFFETKKLKYYKRQSFSYKEKKIISNKFILNSMMCHLTKKVRAYNIFFQFKVVNNFVDKKVVLFIFSSLKKYLSLLFTRRFNLYIDLIKITSLYLKEKVSLDSYLNLLTVVFKNLRKKGHSSFFLFIEEFFNLLVFSKNTSIVSSSLIGIKFLINGRLKGKPRSSSICINVGRIPSQTLSSNIEYSKACTYTNKFGVFGFKIWVNRKI